MKLDLLWWRHCRPPREHVAEPMALTTRIIDMSKLISDFGSSPLLQMMNGRWVTLDWRPLPGAYFQYEKQWVKAFESKTIQSDDWFTEDTYSVRISEPIFGSQPVYHWLEDEMMPRVLTSKFVPPGLIITNIS